MHRAVTFIALCLLAAVASAARKEGLVTVQFHLQGRHSDDHIEHEFITRATPGHPNFRKHLNQQELTELFRAPETAVNAAVIYARLRGCQNMKIVNTRDIVTCTVKVGTASAKALGISAAMFKNAAARQVVATPSMLGKHVKLTVAITHARSTFAEKKLTNFPGMTQTPITISARYNIPTTDVAAPANYSQGVAEFEGSQFNPSDMQTFATKYNLTYKPIKVDNDNSGGMFVEGTLDLQYITGLNGGVTTWWLDQTNGDFQPGNIDFASWSAEVLAVKPQPPSVVSISWGMGTYRYDLDKAIMDADNTAFKKMGLSGITVLVASGDSGPGARVFLSCQKFMPGWPSSSPYITSVGATYALSETAEETSVSFSGGGFSDRYSTPSWQKEAVAAYLNSTAGLPNASFYNANGRGFPDVSAFGTNFMVHAPSQFEPKPHWQQVSGTSCASPTFASVLSRINAENIAAGKAALGFINPTIYKLGRVGHDVQAGKSVDMDCFGIIPETGFPAVKGWDAVSGLGSPDYKFLKTNL